MSKYRKGDLITYTTGPLGAVVRVGHTRFLDHAYDAQTDERGFYVEPIDIGGESWHVTSKAAPTTVGISGEYVFRGPFVIVSDDMIKPLRKNSSVIEREAQS